MPQLVEEFTDDIARMTHFCDIRDLLQHWHDVRRADLPDYDDFAPLFSSPLGDRLMLLAPEGGRLRYVRSGGAVAALFGNDPTGRLAGEIENEGAQALRDRYGEALAGGVPVLAVQRRIGLGTLGTSERLMLPLSRGTERNLFVYVRAREDNNDILRAVFNGSGDSISVFAAVREGTGRITDFRFVAVNMEGARRLRTEPDRLIGRTISECAPFLFASPFFGHLIEAVETRRTIAFEARFATGEGHADRALRLVPFGDGLVVSAADIGPIKAAAHAIEEQRNALVAANALLEQRAADLSGLNRSLEETTAKLREKISRNAALETELKRRAQQDSLTGLINRSEFEVRCTALLDEMQRKRRKAALCMIDLDHFKDVNDMLGHTAGDAVLTGTAARISAAIRRSDLVARLGGDEFAVVFTHTADAADAVAAAQRLVNVLSEPFTVYGHTVPMSASVGVAVFPDHGRTAGALLADADMALYQTKRSGRSGITLFTPALRDDTERRVEVQKRFGLALDAGEIVPYYQPLLDIASGVITGFEALARWNDPYEGLKSPASFIAAIEDATLGQRLTAVVIEAVLADLAAWRGAPVPRRVGVNVTAADLRRPGFVQQVLGGLAAFGMEDAELVIEVTESIMLSRSSDRMEDTIAALRRNGLKIALDDFGTGYASLTHLMCMTVDSIKIDRSFVRDLGREAKATAIVDAMIRLARTLGLKTIAEGVETAEQLLTLAGLGCDLAQGYLIARPMPAAAIPDFIRSFGLKWPRRAADAA